jgi:hypothetical protein
MLIKTAREVARQLVQGLPPIGDPAEPGPAATPPRAQPQAAQPQVAQPHVARPHTAQPQIAQPQAGYAQPAPRGARRATGPQPAAGPHPGWSSGTAPQPAVTLSAPVVSDDAPRTTFSRVRGQPGRHQAELPGGQPGNGEAQAVAATQASAQSLPRVARHAHGGNRQETGIRQETGDRHGSFFSRPPMTPLTTSDTQAPGGLPEHEQENPEDTGWAAPRDRQGPAGSMGSRRPGGG